MKSATFSAVTVWNGFFGEMLQNTSESIEEIAYQVGYSSSGSLINLFVKKEGMSPSAYRRLIQST